MPPNTPQTPTSNPVGGMPQNQQPLQGPLMSPPKRKNNTLLVALVVASVFFIISLIFAIWSFMGMQKYKNNSDEIVAVEVEKTKQETATQKDNEFLEKEKTPYRNYTSSDVLASIKFDYPKTWSAFIEEDKNTNSGTPLNGYLHPNFVPAVDSGTDFALRIEVISRPYSDSLKELESKVKQGKIKIAPYSLAKVPTVLGVRASGEINKGQNDTMVMLPIRDKTLKVYTESQQFVPDLDKIILASLTFVP